MFEVWLRTKSSLFKWLEGLAVVEVEAIRETFVDNA